MKIINNVKFLKLLFYFGFFCCGLLAFYVYIHPFQAANVTASYDPSADRFYNNYEGEVINYFTCDVKKFNSISIFLGKNFNASSINVFLIDDMGSIIYNHQFTKKDFSDVIDFSFPVIDNSYGKKYKLLLKSDESFQIYNTLSKSDDNYLEGDKKNTLIFTVNGYKNNYFYIWYPIMMFAVLYVFYVMIGGSKNDKKNK